MATCSVSSPPTSTNIPAETPGLQKEPWESRYHWLCRRKFIEDHKNMYPPDRLICLSMVWANINFMDAKYSEGVEHQVSYYPVPDKSELARWLSAHSDIEEEERKSAREEEVKVNLKRTLTDPDVTPPPTKLSKTSSVTHSDTQEPSSDASQESSDSMSFTDLTQHLGALISTIRKKNDLTNNEPSTSCAPTGPPSQSPSLTQTVVNERLKKDPRWIKTIKLLSCWCLCPKCFQGDASNPVCCLDVICSKSKLTLEYDLESETTPTEHVAKVFIDRVCMCCLVGPFKKAAKSLAAQCIMTWVHEHQEKIRFECPATGRQVINKVDIVGDGYKEEKISEDNRGHQMLTKMGWTGDKGLGAHGQGQQEPVATAHWNQTGRVGLGSGTHSSLSPQTIRSMLNEFLLSEELQLEFSSDLTSDDRKLIHTLAEQFHLIHKSRGTGTNRFLVLEKKTGFSYRNEVLGSGTGPVRHGNVYRGRMEKPYIRY